MVSNGDCLKGTGSNGNGGVFVLNGDISLKSLLGNGLKSKNGNINIYNGNLDISYTKADGINAKNYYVNILEGKVIIDNCYGDGIQGQMGSNSTYDANTAFGIVDGNNNIILSICPNKKYSYVLYTSPKLTAGTTYSIYSGESVSGNKLSFLLYMFFLHMSFRQHLSQYGLVLAVQTARP